MTTDDKHALQAAVDAMAAAGGGTLLLTDVYTVYSDLTIPCTVTVRTSGSGRIIVPTGVTVTMQGRVDMELGQWIGTDDVAFCLEE